MQLGILFVLAATTFACQHNGRVYHNGECWTESNYKLTCRQNSQRWQVVVTACVAPGNFEIAVGCEANIGQYTYRCVNSGQGVNLQSTIREQAHCNGHVQGSVWYESAFQFRCDEGGKRTLLNCRTNSGVLIPKNEERLDGQYFYKCVEQEDGRIVLDARRNPVCVDSYGVTHAPGSQWYESAFQFQCTEEGKRTLLNCKTNSGVLVPKNEEILSGRYFYKCTEEQDGTVRLDPRLNPVCIDCYGVTHQPGAQWYEQQAFQFRCDEGGKKTFLNCKTNNGLVVAKNTEALDGGYYYKCVEQLDGTVRLDNRPNLVCDCNGIIRVQGEEWVETNVVKKCQNGVTPIVACVFSDVSLRVPLNSMMICNNIKYSCSEKNGQVHFEKKNIN